MKNKSLMRATLSATALLPFSAFAGVAMPTPLEVPTLGTLGLIGLGATLGVLGIRYFKSRKK